MVLGMIPGLSHEVVRSGVMTYRVTIDTAPLHSSCGTLWQGP